MSVLVVGGGITGLAAARDLARDGVPVTLVEAGDRLGGKVSTERVDGLVIERGPDSFLATRPAAVALARELGLGDALVGTRDPRAVYIRHRGELVPMPEGLGLVLPTRALPFARTRLFSWPEKARMAKDVVWPRTLGDDDIAVGTFLRRRLGDALVDRLAGPLVGGVYGTPIDDLSLDAVVPQLRAAERDHRSLLLAGLADGRAMRRAAAARAAAARATTAAPGSRPKPLGVFTSLRGGMDTLIDALAASLADAGADIRTGLAVDALARAGAGVTATFGDGTTGRYDAVILATPAPVAAALLDDEIPGASRALRAIPHGTSILVTLAYPRASVGREIVGHGYLVPPTEGGPIAACTWSSEKWPDRAPDRDPPAAHVRARRGHLDLDAGGGPGRRRAHRCRAHAPDRRTAVAGARVPLRERDAPVHRGPPRPRRDDRGSDDRLARGRHDRCLVPGCRAARLHLAGACRRGDGARAPGWWERGAGAARPSGSPDAGPPAGFAPEAALPSSVCVPGFRDGWTAPLSACRASATCLSCT